MPETGCRRGDPELTIVSGLRLAEVPTTLAPDGRSRPPYLRSWRYGWRHLKGAS